MSAPKYIRDFIKRTLVLREFYVVVVRPLGQFAKKSIFRLRGGTRFGQKYDCDHLAHGLAGRDPHTDISDHLGHIFFFAAAARPGLIVELGTRGGESTRALLCAAAIHRAKVLSLDIEDCHGLDLPHRELWHFVKADDVAFGKNHFTDWCQQQQLLPKAELIFIDTTHEYGHTKQEIETWMPHLAEGGTMIFHDSNMGCGPYARLDGSVGYGWDNHRGVIRAIEEFFGQRYNEDKFLYDYRNDFLILHHPNCNGLTILKHCVNIEVSR